MASLIYPAYYLLVNYYGYRSPCCNAESDSEDDEEEVLTSPKKGSRSDRKSSPSREAAVFKTKLLDNEEECVV